MSTINTYSPLRYPGGKAAAASYFKEVLLLNGITKHGTYCEPFAGGAGVALTLLLTGCVGRIVINDFDKCIYSFWQSIIRFNKKFIRSILECDISIEKWSECRYIYDNSHSLDMGNDNDLFKLGFATFFLNRTNRAGILPKAGPIGGRSQVGKYRIDARFKKDVLIKRIIDIGAYADNIDIFCDDSISFLKNIQRFMVNRDDAFIYLDPPYYKRGHELYLNFFDDSKHKALARYMKDFTSCKWMMTYDDCDEIKKIYSEFGFSMREFTLQYSMQHVRKVREILIYPNYTKI